jgi:hypothetical protein
MFCTSRRIRIARSMTCWPAAVAHEDLKAELVLEQLDLLAHARLGGVQLLGGRSDVETALRDGGEVSELVQFHPGILANARAAHLRRSRADSRLAAYAGLPCKLASMHEPRR